MKKLHKDKKGFSLIELIIVIAIIAILTAILIPAIMTFIRNSKLRDADSNANSAASAVKSAYKDVLTSGDPFDSTTIMNKAKDIMGSSYDADNIDIVMDSNNRVVSVKWTDNSANYWAEYTISEGRVTSHGDKNTSEVVN